MKRIIICLFVLSMLFAVSSAFAVQTQLLQNADFEQPTVTPWEFNVWGGTSTIDVAPAEFPAHSGTKVGILQGPGGGQNSLQYMLTGLAPNTPFHAAAWFRSADATPANPAWAAIRFRWNSATGDMGAVIRVDYSLTDTEWHYVGGDAASYVGTLTSGAFTLPNDPLLVGMSWRVYGQPDRVIYVDDVDFTVAAHTVSGRVVNDQGVVQAGAKVYIGSTDPPSTAAATVLTAADGTYTTLVADGIDLYAMASVGGLYADSPVVTLPAATTAATAPDLVVSKVGTKQITGRVIDSVSKEGIADVTVVANVSEAGGLSGAAFSTVTAADGTYVLDVMDPNINPLGTYEYYVRVGKFPYAPNPSAAQYVDVSAGANPHVLDDVELTLSVPIIDISAANLAPGTLSTWTNTGSLGGSFGQDTTLAGLPTVTMVGGKKAVKYNGSSCLKLDQLAPVTLSGAHPWSVVSWLNCPVTNGSANRTYLSWSQRGTNFMSAEMRFADNYAVAHYGADNGFASVPAPGVWHHIAVTYDGVNEVVYVDGVASTTVTGRTLNLYPNQPIFLGRAFNNADGTGSAYPWAGAMASLQVYDAAIPASAIATIATQTPPNADVNIITASAATGATITPSGAVPVMIGESQTFTFGSTLGYAVSDVIVDGVSQGIISSYTFPNVTAAHTVSVEAVILATSTISGTVKDKNGNAISGATVYFSATKNASINSFATATTAADGTYTKTAVPQGTVYVSGGAAGYWNSGDKAITLGTEPATANVVLSSNVRNIPQTDKMWFSVVTDTLPATGSTGAWAPYAPNPSIAPILASYTMMGNPTPVVEYVDNMKWERNSRASGDNGFLVGKYTSGDPTTGLSIVAAVRPIYNNPPIGGEVRGEIVDIGYSELWLSVSHNTGDVQVCRRGYIVASTGYKIPDGQKTVLSLVVTAPAGQMTLYANGAQVWQLESGIDYSALSYMLDTNLSIGRNAWDGWSAFNGNIGDVFVYKTALPDTDRQGLEADLMSKFGIPTPQNVSGTVYQPDGVTPLAGARVFIGTSSPATAVTNSSVIADANGNFTFVNIAPGTYYLNARKTGFAPAGDISVTVVDAPVSGANIVMAGIVPLTKLVDLKATGLAAGPITEWINNGTAGGKFTTVAAEGTPPEVKSVGGVNAVSITAGYGLASDISTPAVITGTNPWTIAAWVYRPAEIGWQGSEECIIGLGNANPYDLVMLNYSTDTAWGLIDSGVINFGTATPPEMGVWHSIVATYDGAALNYYADKVLLGSGIGALRTPAEPMTIGFIYDGSNMQSWSFSWASIASIEIYDGDMSKAAVDAIFDAGPPTGAVVKPFGANNKSVMTDAKLVGKTVKVWGKVMSTDAGSYVISDGYSTGLKINGTTSLVAGDMAIVTGIVQSDHSVTP